MSTELAVGPRVPLNLIMNKALIHEGHIYDALQGFAYIIKNDCTGSLAPGAMNRLGDNSISRDRILIIRFVGPINVELCNSANFAGNLINLPDTLAQQLFSSLQLSPILVVLRKPIEYDMLTS